MSQLASNYSLPTAMTIETVEAVVADLKQLSVQSSTLTLDASETEIITTAGAQVLLSFAKALEVKGANLAVKNARPSFSHTFLQLGLAHHFLKWEAK